VVLPDMPGASRQQMCFELIPQGGHVAYEPFSFQQAVPPVYQEVFENGLASENHRLKRQLTGFARIWDRNLQEQVANLVGPYIEVRRPMLTLG
jgi:hypothetical protein